jgi:hypothetical protein
VTNTTRQDKLSAQLYKCELHELSFSDFQELQIHLANSAIHRIAYRRLHRYLLTAGLSQKNARILATRLEALEK